MHDERSACSRLLAFLRRTYFSKQNGQSWHGRRATSPARSLARTTLTERTRAACANPKTTQLFLIEWSRKRSALRVPSPDGAQTTKRAHHSRSRLLRPTEVATGRRDQCFCTNRLRAHSRGPHISERAAVSRMPHHYSKHPVTILYQSRTTRTNIQRYLTQREPTEILSSHYRAECEPLACDLATR